MTKANEMAVLAEAIAKLGTDSYLGPWLAAVKAEVEHDMAADICPSIMPHETANECAALLADAKREALAIIDKAKRDAQELQRRSVADIQRLAVEVERASMALNRAAGVL